MAQTDGMLKVIIHKLRHQERVEFQNQIPLEASPQQLRLKRFKVIKDVANSNTAAEDGYSYRLVEITSLLQTFQSLHICEHGGELKVCDDEARRYGNSSVIVINCTKCDTEIELQTPGHKSEGWNPKNCKDVNRRMVYSAMEMGVGRDNIGVMCDIFNMPPPCHHNSWDRHLDALYKAHKEEVAKQLQQARNEVHALHGGHQVSEIAVSYDGTWSRRGYTANFGVGFVISVDTGKVLDYDFESKLCSECTSTKKDLGEDTPEFDIWFQGHKDHCTKTHTGSSGSMECSIARKIWD